MLNFLNNYFFDEDEDTSGAWMFYGTVGVVSLMLIVGLGSTVLQLIG